MSLGPGAFASVDIAAGWAWPVPERREWRQVRASWDPFSRALVLRVEGAVVSAAYSGRLGPLLVGSRLLTAAEERRLMLGEISLEQFARETPGFEVRDPK